MTIVTLVVTTIQKGDSAVPTKYLIWVDLWHREQAADNRCAILSAHRANQRRPTVSVFNADFGASAPIGARQ